MLKIFHNPRCAKSRAGLKFLEDNSIEHTVFYYLKESLKADEIKHLCKITALTPFDLVRTQEDYYKKNLKGKVFSDEEWFNIIAENPKLLQRPIVVKENKGVFAQPPEKINDLL